MSGCVGESGTARPGLGEEGGGEGEGGRERVMGQAQEGAREKGREEGSEGVEEEGGGEGRREGGRLFYLLPPHGLVIRYKYIIYFNTNNTPFSSSLITF